MYWLQPSCLLELRDVYGKGSPKLAVVFDRSLSLVASEFKVCHSRKIAFRPKDAINHVCVDNRFQELQPFFHRISVLVLIKLLYSTQEILSLVNISAHPLHGEL